VQEFNFTFLGERVYMPENISGYKGGASVIGSGLCTLQVLYYADWLGIGYS